MVRKEHKESNNSARPLLGNTQPNLPKKARSWIQPSLTTGKYKVSMISSCKKPIAFGILCTKIFGHGCRGVETQIGNRENSQKTCIKQYEYASNKYSNNPQVKGKMTWLEGPVASRAV